MSAKKPKHPEFDDEATILERVVRSLAGRASSGYFNSEIYDQSHEIAARGRELSKSEKEVADALQDAPYFGRFDFKEKRNKHRETFYVTKYAASIFSAAPEITLVSWQAPFASFWYEKSRHKVSNGKATGEVFLRRLLEIRHQALLNIIDEFDARPEVRRILEDIAEIIDPDLYLRKVLEGKQGNRLSEIVITIQEEQNRLMRSLANQILVIQGSPGTGKTTVALHRVAILTYNENPKEKTNYNVMIIGPSKIFLDSISQVLPSLNLTNIPQRTFTDWALASTGYRNINVNDDTFFEVQDINQNKLAFERSKFKGSLRFKKILEELAEKYRFQHTKRGRIALYEGSTAYPTGDGSLGMVYQVRISVIREAINESSNEPINIQRDIVVNKILQMMYEQHSENYEMWLVGIKNNLMEKENFELEQIGRWTSQIERYGHISNNIFITVSEIENRSLRHLRDELQRITGSAYERYSPLEVFISFITNITQIEEILESPSLRNQHIELITLLKKVEQSPVEIQKLEYELSNMRLEYRRASGVQNERIRQQITSKEKDLKIQKSIIEENNKEELENQLVELEITINQREEESQLILSEYATTKSLREEDVASLTYLHQLFNGRGEQRLDHIIVDEAQDMSPFQMSLLRNATQMASMTILGDIAQSIHSYRGIDQWEDLADVFNDDPLSFEEMKVSYRSTFEITSFCNEILKKRNKPFLSLAEPFERHGEAVSTKVFKDKQHEVVFIQDFVLRLQSEGFKSIALICRTDEQCTELGKMIKKFGTQIALSKFDQLSENDVIRIIPIYNSKGLEFEAVVLIDVSVQNYQSDFEAQLLYVGATRALHRLLVTCIGRESRFLP